MEGKALVEANSLVCERFKGSSDIRTVESHGWGYQCLKKDNESLRMLNHQFKAKRESLLGSM